VPDLAFRPLRRADFERLRGWLNEPHVYAWWGADAAPDGLGGPGPQAATPAQVDAEYGPAADGLDPTARFVILVDGDPVGLIQWYQLADSPEYAGAIAERAGAGVDLLIGDPTRVGSGIGPAVIDRFVTEVVFAQPGVHRCVAGPDVRNERSIRAFTAAGFVWVRDASVPGEPAPEHVMVRTALGTAG
jgi:RimJ/RimL family protein N-acetyltransferase